MTVKELKDLIEGLHEDTEIIFLLSDGDSVEKNLLFLDSEVHMDDYAVYLGEE